MVWYMVSCKWYLGCGGTIAINALRWYTYRENSLWYLPSRNYMKNPENISSPKAIVRLCWLSKESNYWIVARLTSWQWVRFSQTALAFLMHTAYNVYACGWWFFRLWLIQNPVEDFNLSFQEFRNKCKYYCITYTMEYKVMRFINHCVIAI